MNNSESRIKNHQRSLRPVWRVEPSPTGAKSAFSRPKLAAVGGGAPPQVQLRKIFQCLCLCISVLGISAAAETLQGTITNGTVNQPSAGDDVALIALSQGMTAIAHAKSDAGGRFRLEYADENGAMPHLVRVTHQDVNYFKMAPPGTSTVEVQVYDAATKLEGISTTVEVMRFQSEGNGLDAALLLAVNNASSPPRSLGGDRTYEFELPEGAKIEAAAARGPGGQPINTMPGPVAGQKNRYAFNFPLRPGETQFQVSYSLPYTGAETRLRTTVLQDAQHFVAVAPLSMNFSAGGAEFSPMTEEKDTNVQVATNIPAGTEIALTLSGIGALPAENGQPQASGGNSSGGMSTRQGPGGGLGKPIDSPDPLFRYRWWMLAGLAAVLVMGGFYVAGQRKPAVYGGRVASHQAPAIGRQSSGQAQSPAFNAVAVKPPASAFLEGLKDELFNLEIERQQGRISDAEYAQTKAALDTTLKRAIARNS